MTDNRTYKPYFETSTGKVYLGDSLDVIPSELEDHSVDLVMTSPPFGLVRKKDYGNVDADKYVQWFWPFAREFYRILKPTGSFVLDIGGSWIPGQPTPSSRQLRPSFLSLTYLNAQTL